ncbi:MAG: putative sulfate exporter family transporter [Chloroflexota bacterium]
MLQISSKRTLVSGIFVVVLVGSLAWWLSEANIVPRIGSVTIAILLGVIVGNLVFNNPMGIQGATFAEKKILPISIALLGVELQLLTLLDLGLSAAIIIAIAITSSLLLAIGLGQLFGFSRNFSLLIGAGNGICGSSAVAATSIAIEAEEADTGISISVVNLLGTVGIFLMPALINFLTLSDLQGGLLTGGTLQAFGQVVAAGFSVNDDVGNIATVVKMGRVMMLGPIVVLLGTWAQSQFVSDEKKKAKVRIPRFIFGFFVMSIIASIGILPDMVLDIVKTSGKYLLVIAMAGIGMRIQLRTLFQSGFRALLFGGLVSILQIAIVLIVIVTFI